MSPGTTKRGEEQEHEETWHFDLEESASVDFDLSERGAELAKRGNQVATPAFGQSGDGAESKKRNKIK